jgi:adenosylcobinamide-GDP ribazoletransferase
MAITSPKGLLSALRTLTVISWPGKEGKDIASALPWFPVIGLVLGTVLYATACAWRLLPISPWPAAAALILLVVEVWLTRGLHLDGLADWADSLGGLLNRETRLEIMKDSHVGTFGVLALILILMAKWMALERMMSSGSMIWIIPLLVISRDMMVELIVTLPYARTGQGMGKAFVDGASQGHRFVSHGLGLLICIPFGPLGPASYFFSVLLTRAYGRRCQKGFGGITGDLLGAWNEMSEVVLFLLYALPGKDILSYTGW